ncbi:substrate-binding periplasmic protein [Undibacterium flavidum]|uniref:Transporter substrate-binding domain-containing protein n=1 Tax=Undibacterium flavidum TaxID=2762297 RepID=A0ABR6YGN9_9BURK|nr:transporter substrate-binding domain-containing protein [Undibacterium flavidum]MBC3875751.1 transporter substrate-binding domain-containing protein [Undibacterium flavidum]
MAKLRFLGLSLLLSLMTLNAYATTVIKVYTYHLKPPFVVREATRNGLYFDAIDYFNKRSTQYQFELHYLPRRRLDLMVNAGTLDGLVIGVNPLWFNDKQEHKYLWTGTLLHDVDEVISTNEKAFEYTGLESLTGLRVGLVLGYYYFGVSEMAVAGKLMRDDASSEDHNFKKLLADRIDVAIISRSNHDFVMKHQPELVGKFYISSKPHDQYERRIMIPLSMTKVHKALAAIVSQMHSDPVWKERIASYR